MVSTAIRVACAAAVFGISTLVSVWLTRKEKITRGVAAVLSAASLLVGILVVVGGPQGGGATPPQSTVTPTGRSSQTPTATPTTSSTPSPTVTPPGSPTESQTPAPPEQFRVSLRTLCQGAEQGDCPLIDQPIQIGSQLFPAEVAQGDALSVPLYPTFDVLAGIRNSTCTRLELRFAVAADDSQNGTTAYVKIITSAGTQRAQAPTGKLGAIAADLPDGSFQIQTAVSGGSKETVLAGTAVCTTESGVTGDDSQ